MKKIFLMLVMALATHLSNAQVNSLDTLVFDISQAVTTGSYVEVPVSFLSDDTIVAVDFSFKYNHTNFICDSIIDLTSYLQELWYYNNNDSTMRFTSYSLQNIPNNTSVVMVRFNTLSGQLCSSDLNTVKGYLNGDACSINVVNCIPNSLEEMKHSIPFSFYPNPAHAKLSFEAKEELFVSLFDLSGREVVASFFAEAFRKHEINISGIRTGVYLIKVVEKSGVVHAKKIIITD